MHNLIRLLQRRHWVWHGSEQKAAAGRQASGYEDLDARLGGGLPENGVVDICSTRGIGELRLLLPYLTQKPRLLVFVCPPGLVCAEQLFHCGIDPGRTLLIRARTPEDGMWASEQCLKSGACGAVLMWHERLDVRQVRRFQIASEAGNCPLFVFRQRALSGLSLPVALGLTLLPDVRGLQVQIRKVRGGWPQPLFALTLNEHWKPLIQPYPVNSRLSLPESAVPGSAERALGS